MATRVAFLILAASELAVLDGGGMPNRRWWGLILTRSRTGVVLRQGPAHRPVKASCLA